jgi:two-component system response regulator RstA
MGCRILLVEDDQKLADVVCEFLRGKGFEVRHEADGGRVEARVGAEPPDLILLDLLLPSIGGLEVCRRVRPSFRGPILMLTALGDEIDEVLGLELGADDYLTKPVRPRVLLARIQALLRRAQRASSPSRPPGAQPQPLAFGSLWIDVAAREARFDGRMLELTAAEFDLLHYLAERAGQVVRREHISRDLRGIEWDGLDRTIDIRVARLRRKLGDAGRSPEVIKSVRGEGYLLAVRR